LDEPAARSLAEPTCFGEVGEPVAAVGDRDKSDAAGGPYLSRSTERLTSCFGIDEGEPVGPVVVVVAVKTSSVVVSGCVVGVVDDINW
jgi:hypothetical protein